MMQIGKRSSLCGTQGVLPEEETMAVMDYRTRDGLDDYGFWIEYQPDAGWRVYTVFQPPLRGVDDSVLLPHQSVDAKGRRYVDWPEKLDSLGDAQAVAALWAELAQRNLRDQEQRALYVELIEGYMRAQEQRRARSVSRNRSEGSISGTDTGVEDPTRHSAVSVIAHSGDSAKSIRDSQESERTGHVTDDVA
jgi:hypothetical protein